MCFANFVYRYLENIIVFFFILEPKEVCPRSFNTFGPLNLCLGLNGLMNQIRYFI